MFPNSWYILIYMYDKYVYTYKKTSLNLEGTSTSHIKYLSFSGCVSSVVVLLLLLLYLSPPKPIIMIGVSQYPIYSAHWKKRIRLKVPGYTAHIVVGQRVILRYAKICLLGIALDKNVDDIEPRNSHGQ